MNNTTEFNVYETSNLTPFHIVMTVLSVILIFLIASGNILTISAITKFRSLHHQSNVMIAALAVADLLMGVAYTPIRLLRTHLPNIFLIESFCLCGIFVAHYTAICAVVFLSFLSLERFYAIQFPFHYHARATMKVAVIFSAIVYAIIAAALLPLVSGLGNWHEGSTCYAPALYPSVYSRFIVIFAVIPLLLGFLAFMRVCYAEFKFRRQVADMAVSSLRNQQSVRTKLILTAYLVSWCFWMPHLMYYAYDTVTKAKLNVYVFRIVSLLDLGSSAVNCFLYAWKNSKFRAAYKQLLCFKPSPEMTNASSSGN